MRVDLAAADPVTVALRALRESADMEQVLGGGQVGGLNEPPYPRVTVTDTPGGDDRGLRWLIAPELQIEALGDLDGRHGKASLRRIVYTALGVLVEVPEQPTRPGEPVVTAVVSTGAAGWTPLATGQGRYLATVRMYLHPPQ